MGNVYRALFVVLSCVCVTTSAFPTAQGKAVQFSDLKFTTELYKLLRQDRSGENLFFSPFSIASALALLRVGARGATAKQITEALGLRHGQDSDRIYSSLMTILDNNGNVTLEMANKLYAHRSGFDIVDDFNSTLRSSYDTVIERLDFGNPEKARQEINHWVEEKTRDKIQDLLPSGSINAMTRMVIANAIYFKGEWAQRFDTANTGPAEFHVSDLQGREVDMMRITDDFVVADVSNAWVVDIPYQGEKIVMTLVVPKEKSGLSAIEDKLTSSLLTNYLRDDGHHRRTRKVQLHLPRFKIEASFGLKKFLDEMGIKDMFVPGQADLSGIAAKNYSLFVDEGFHKAFVEVNEKGTEAAAATVITLIPLSAVLDFSEPIQIRVDRPSLIIIRHEDIVDPLFFGRLSAPAERVSEKSGPPPQQKRPSPAIPSSPPVVRSGVANGNGNGVSSAVVDGGNASTRKGPFSIPSQASSGAPVKKPTAPVFGRPALDKKSNFESNGVPEEVKNSINFPSGTNQPVLNESVNPRATRSTSPEFRYWFAK